jgi:hypothetical protein
LDILKDWGLLEAKDLATFSAQLHKRCLKEGVQTLEVDDELIAKFVEPKPAKNEEVQPSPQQNALAVGKKQRKSKVTLDESLASEDHGGVDPFVPSGSKDPA